MAGKFQNTHHAQHTHDTQNTRAAQGLRIAPIPAGVTNTEALGRLLYTDYVFLFQSAGLVLLVAMIGAIVLTLRDKQTSRHQSIRVQTERKVADTLEMVDVGLGVGTADTGFLRPKEPELETADHGHGHGHGERP